MILRHKHRDFVSWSEISTWKTCKQRWYYAYFRRLAPKDVSRVMRFGSLAHIGLAAFLLGAEWKVAVDDEVRRSSLDKFDEDIQDQERLGDDVKDVLGRYLAKHGKDYKIVELDGRPLVEVEFEIPVRGVSTKLKVRIDAVCTDAGTGLWLFDHKFPSKQLRPVDDVEMSTQLGIYHYAAMRAGVPIVGVVYNQILGKMPAVPKLNKDGTMSRAEVNTDWDTYQYHLSLCGLDPADYTDMQAKLAGKEFVRRTRLYREKSQVRGYQDELTSVVYDLTAPKKYIYMCDNAIHCRGCAFRELCAERMRGKDPEPLIEELFEVKKNPDDHTAPLAEEAVVA